MTNEERKVIELALEALEEIALAGMSGTGQESDEAMTAWHARQAWKFIGIAARALGPIKEALAQPEQEPVAFPRQAGDSTWIVDTAFIWRVKHTIDPDTPHDFIPSEEQIETALLALEKIPSGIYTTPPQRKPLTDEDIFDNLNSVFGDPKHHKIPLTRGQIIDFGRKMFDLGTRPCTNPPQRKLADELD